MNGWAPALITVFIALASAHIIACAPLTPAMIELNATSSIMLPEIRSEGLETGPLNFSTLAVFDGDGIGGGIGGRLLVPEAGNGTIEVCASPVGLRDILSLSFGDRLANDTLNVSLNSSGAGSFVLAPPPGAYILSAYCNGTLMSARPVFVADGWAALEAPEEIAAGDMIMLGLHIPENRTFFFGGALVSTGDYENMSLRASRNESGIFLVVSNGEIEAAWPRSPSLSALSDLYAVIPDDCAIMIPQEVSGNSTEAYLITDPGWEPGTYLLICAAYARDGGMTGIWQKPVEVH